MLQGKSLRKWHLVQYSKVIELEKFQANLSTINRKLCHYGFLAPCLGTQVMLFNHECLVADLSRQSPALKPLPLAHYAAYPSNCVSISLYTTCLTSRC